MNSAFYQFLKYNLSADSYQTRPRVFISLASVRRILFNVMLRFISTRSSDFTGDQGYKLAYFTVKFDHIWLQNINLLIWNSSLPLKTLKFCRETFLALKLIIW